MHIDHHFRKTAFSNFKTEQQNFNCTPITGSSVAGFLKRIWIQKKIEETQQWSDSYGKKKDKTFLIILLCTIFQLENNSSLARLIFFLMLHIFFYQFLEVAQNIIKHWNLLKGPQQAMNKIYWYSTIKQVFGLSVNVFNTKVLFEDTIFVSPYCDRTAILRSHPSHAKI